MSRSAAIYDPSGKTTCPRLVSHGPKACMRCAMLSFCTRGADGANDLRWHCARCGLGNELKYCSNCGEERS